jgi:Asp-tRNA(Asn)/Glu-tRNA(Gln) amidotransferase A subunit family amidase
MERDRLLAELLQWMETTPIIIAPVGSTPAYPHDTLKVTVRGSTFGTFRAFSYAQTFSVFNLPVVTIPARKSNDGLPIGVQIAGLPFAEEMILAAAEIVETALSVDSTISDI